MKTIGSILILALSIQSFVFAAPCDAEREKATKQQSLCNSWETVTGVTIIGGMVVGSYVTKSWIGGLGGLLGLVPGVVTWRVCVGRDNDLQKLAECEKHQVETEKKAEEEKKDTLASTKAEAASYVVSGIFVNKMARFQRMAQQEMIELIDRRTNERIERFLEEGGDPEDLDAIRRINTELSTQLEPEVEAIRSKYF